MSERRLKPGWRVWRFDQMAENVNDRVDDPSQAGVDRYVGLEHLDSDSLRIRRWGVPSDVEATKLRFSKGDIIFGRRRAYQRKLAVADFDGICSAHAMVLRARPEVISPELLPFVMQSDTFMELAKDISVGSLSPTINWKTLARQDFALPPASQQADMVGLLAAWANQQEGARDSLTAAERMRRSLLLHLCEYGTGDINDTVTTPCGTLPVSWQALPLGCRYQVQLGKMISEKARTTAAGQTPYIRNANVQWRRLDLSDVATMAFSARERDKFALRFGDLLACEGRHVGKSALWRDEIPGACYQKSLHRLRRLSDQDLPEWLLACLEYYSLTGRFRGETGETTIPHLPAERLRALIFPFPPREEQEEICKTLQACDRSIAAAEQRVERSAELGRQLRETIFNGSLP